jgi:hypothetical protein
MDNYNTVNQANPITKVDIYEYVTFHLSNILLSLQSSVLTNFRFCRGGSCKLLNYIWDDTSIVLWITDHCFFCHLMHPDLVHGEWSTPLHSTLLYSYSCYNCIQYAQIFVLFLWYTVTVVEFAHMLNTNLHLRS